MARVCALMLAAAFLVGPSLADDNVTVLRSRFDAETDPVRRAKLLPKVGEAQFRLIRQDLADGRVPEAAAELGRYRDEARRCMDGLDAAKIDAERHSAGFKQLQISLRESLRRLNEIIAGLSSDEQAPFLQARGDLDEINRRLVQDLFPHEPPAAVPAQKDSH